MKKITPEEALRRWNRRAPAVSEPNWKTMALDCLHALQLINAHYDDISKNNPGFIGKLCLQRYNLWNEALLVSEGALRKYANVPNKRAGEDAKTIEARDWMG